MSLDDLARIGVDGASALGASTLHGGHDDVTTGVAGQCRGRECDEVDERTGQLGESSTRHHGAIVAAMFTGSTRQQSADLPRHPGEQHHATE
ncbi:MAG: hypothetical protein EBX99_07905 [Acidimicrobiia bacterium]|nr:hypothetical protein [Acidimicrobiia bacterium]